MSLADLFAAEQAAVTAGDAAACGYTCECHGTLVCARATHPDEPDNRSPHLAVADGGLVQWVGGCCDGMPDTA